MWAPSTRAVAPGELARISASGTVVAAHAWAVWNAYDREYDRRLAGMRLRFADRVEFVSLDVDSAGLDDVCWKERIGNVPALVVFVNGTWCDTLVGMRTISEVEEFLTRCVVRAGPVS
jgi:thioredoxin-like negative regulator of GroEL